MATASVPQDKVYANWQKRPRSEVRDDQHDELHHVRRKMANQQRRIEQLEAFVAQVKQRADPTDNPETMCSYPFECAEDLDKRQQSPTDITAEVHTQSMDSHTFVCTPQTAERGSPVMCHDTHEMLDDTFRQLEVGLRHESFGGLEADDDLLIRSIVNGWSEATKKYRLDTVWRFLRMLDQYIYQPMEMVSRLAALRALRAMLLRKIRPAGQPLREIPSFLMPTDLQQKCGISSMSDYLVWPAMRNYFVRNPRELRFAPRSAQTTFAMHFRFDWPYELRDAYIVSRASDRLRFSPSFDERYNQLQCWQIRPHKGITFIPAQLWPMLPVPPCNSLHVVDLTDDKEPQECNALSRHASASPQDKCVNSTDLQTAIASLATYQTMEDLSATNSEHQGADSSQGESLGDSGSQNGTNSDRRESLGDWGWAFDSARPEFESVQQILNMAMPP